MKKEIYPKLTLIGAGPGDETLITVKGANALGNADVVLYDALVNKEILKYAPIDALKIFVGKRRNNHEYTQEQINSLIVDLAFTHGNVVRLKGGDPHVFGRGNEEIKYAEIFNIETEFIPGISSSIGVPGLAGIPVTQRGVSESFWVITGTTSEGKISKDVAVAAKTDVTVVILMGVHKLNEITEIFKKEGKEDTAVAVIQNGSLPSENYALATIDTIVEAVNDAGISSPAVIVIGDVVKQHNDFPVELTNWKYLLN